MAENYKFRNYAGAEMAEMFDKIADLDVATQSKAGLMSATDKTKLDELPAGAQANVLEGVQLAGTDLTITDKKVNIPVDNAPTEGSSALIRSGAVFSAGYATKEELSQLGQKIVDVEQLDNVTPININGEFSADGYDKLMFSQNVLSGVKYVLKIQCPNYDNTNPVYITIKTSNGSSLRLIILRSSLEVDYEFILADNDTISILYGCASPQVVTYELYSNDSRIADLQDELGLVAIKNYDVSHYNSGYVNGRQVGQIATIASGAAYYTEEISLRRGETLKFHTNYDVGWAILAKVLGGSQYLVLTVAPTTDYTGEYTADEDMGVVICGTRYLDIQWAVFSREYLIKGDCVDNLLSDSDNLPLSARQGKILADRIGSTNGNLNINSALYFRDKLYERWGYWVSVPSVATSYADNAYLDKKIAQVPAGKHFIFITDTHIDQWVDENGNYHSIDVEDQGGEHYDNTNYLVGYVKSKMGIQNVVFGGDCLARHDNNDEPYQGARYLSAYSNRFFATFGKDGIWVQGNHDANGANAESDNVIIASTEIFLRTVHAISDNVVFDEDGIAKVSNLSLTDAEKEQVVAWMKMHYYKDDAYNKIRFIVCETGDEGKVSKGIFYTMRMRNSVKTSGNAILAYAQWIIDTIRNTPKGYDIVLLGHYWQQYGLAEYISQIVTAYLKHQRIQIDVEWWLTHDGRVASDALMNMLDDSTILDADFSDIDRNGRIFMLGGHMHYDAEFVHKASSLGNAPVLLQNTTLQDGDALNIFTLCSMIGGQYSSGEIVSPDMIEGTITEHAFDVVTITDDNKLVMTRFGAGNDRIVDLSYQINH